jgi:hypothetical protein
VGLEDFRGYEGDELLRIIGGSLGRVADAAVAVYVQTVETDMHAAGASGIEMARDNATTASMALQLGDALGTLFAHHLWAAIGRQRLAQVGLTERTLMRLAIGFVDLVGFTPLAQELPARELLAVITSLEARAFDVAAASGGRVVKHIGDEIMVVPSTPWPAARRCWRSCATSMPAASRPTPGSPSARWWPATATTTARW